jgi:hypothetical protein
MKPAIVLLLTIFLAGCGGVKFPTEASLYRTACEELTKEGNLPANAKPLPRAEASFFIGKSGACLVIPYEGGDAAEGGSYTVWMKNMAHDWQVDRVYPTPTYNSE